MTKVTHNLGFKVLALFLVVISGVLSLISVSAVIMGGESGFYSGNPRSYYETQWCKWITDQYADRVIDMYQYNPDELANWTENENTNFGYEIRNTSTDEITKSNLPASAGNLENYTFSFYDEYTVDGEWIEHDEPISVELNAYVKAPLTAPDEYWMTFRLYELTYQYRTWMMGLALVSVLIFFVAFIYLLCAAGHRGGTDEIVPNLQDRFPLEIYFGIVALLAVVSSLGVHAAYPFTSFTDAIILLGSFVAFAALGIGMFMTFATRLKMGKWWRNSITYWFFHIIWKFGAGLVTTIRDTITALPMTWKVGAGWIFVSLIYLANANNSGTVFLVNCILLVLLLSVATQLQKLKKAGEQLANGNLDYKVDISKMFRTFRRHGSNLNSLSKGAAIAMEQKIKSERLKTELITNVSHDIKTPLTSIINYVDLLKKEGLSGQAKEYLEVLDRQSRRLKKLTEDLVEASKASTGNISAHLVPTDLCELVHQAVAEYEEKLEKADLEVVVTAVEPVYGMVDGNLTWRVLSNLLSNACKYSQTGTRVYVEIAKKGNFALISMKNISKDQLNIAPAELMERFVRGDSSRSTEGSGLGLNIARSLVELQKGKFTLSIDADLFKAFVQCPLAKEPAPQAQKEEATVEEIQAELDKVKETMSEDKE
ncbi:MAG: HAMP domain-containing histidine kinase [Clostridia bacterium]|nr:HAMP domain-containing histidine kinase [Clostridia bacterium]